MTAGAPHIADSHSRSNTNANRQQAAHIRHLLARGADRQTVAAAVGCTIARVQAVAGGPTPHPAGRRLTPVPLPLDELLAAGHAHPDPAINRLTHSIVGDLRALAEALR